MLLFGLLPALSCAAETPDAALKRIMSQRLVINVHEHLEDMTTAKVVLECMDREGMRKSLLMGSSYFTITMNEKHGFTRVDENNEELLKIAKAYPERFEAWPTLDPADPLKLEKVISLHERGATGIKLYTGHGYARRDNGQYMFRPIAMDDPRMYPLYAYWEEHYVPLCLHVNPFKPGFAQELMEVLRAFPDLKINSPHFMLSSIKDSRLREFLDTYPNLYTDISFGHDDFLIAGLKRISKSPEKFRKLLNDYPDRFMFGTDLVMTNIPSKTVDWFSERAQAYYDMLTKEHYTAAFITEPVDPNNPGGEKRPMPLRGLGISSPLLDKILYQNYERFSAARPKGTKITREINWKNMGVDPVERRPGEALPPSAGGGE